MHRARLVSVLALLAACGGPADSQNGGAGGSQDLGGGGGSGGAGGAGGSGGSGVVVLHMPSDAYAGQIVNLSLDGVSASTQVTWDQDGGTPGTYVATGALGAQWFSPEMSKPTTYTLRATVAGMPYTGTLNVRPPHFKTEVAKIFGVCGGNGCHPRARGDYDFRTAASAYSSLQLIVRVGRCNGPLVVAGNPDSSTLFPKLSGVTCGPQMPEKNLRYFVDNKNLLVVLRSWILAGALNN